MLTFTKAAARRAGAGGVKDEKEMGLVDANLLRPEALDQVGAAGGRGRCDV
jgi:hypothetical protein